MVQEYQASQVTRTFTTALSLSVIPNHPVFYFFIFGRVAFMRIFTRAAFK